MFNIDWIFHQKFQQIFEGVFVCLIFSAPITSCLGNGEYPSCFETFVRDLLLVLLVVQSEGGYEIEENLYELAILETLDNSFSRHITLTLTVYCI